LCVLGRMPRRYLIVRILELRRIETRGSWKEARNLNGVGFSLQFYLWGLDTGRPSFLQQAAHHVYFPSSALATGTYEPDVMSCRTGVPFGYQPSFFRAFAPEALFSARRNQAMFSPNLAKASS